MPNEYTADSQREPADFRRRLLAGLDQPPVEKSTGEFVPPPIDEEPPGQFQNSLTDEVEQLRAENAEWRRLVEEAVAIEQEYEQAKVVWEQREQEYTAIVQERDATIEMLTAQIQELEQHVADNENRTQAPVLPPPTDEDLRQLFDELEVERNKFNMEKRQFEEERRLFKEEEEDLNKQIRDMEVQMSKERAELARQRMELQRLHTEVRTELESMQRGDSQIKDRLLQFQRRQQDIANRPGGGGPTQPPSSTTPPRPQTPTGNRESGIMKRFFGTQGKGGQ